jgi:hypothetical protein
MSNRTPKYPLLKPLPRIDRHDKLPTGSIKLLECSDDSTGRDKLHTLVKHQGHLSILVSYHAGPHDQYFCKQRDFPLKTLSWFPQALEEFRKPPAEGGLHAGAMISKDVDVDGEMLAVGSTTKGYALTNWSRNQQDPVTDYDPAEISLSWHFLYELGLLYHWKILGSQYDRAEI